MAAIVLMACWIPPGIFAATPPADPPPKTAEAILELDPVEVTGSLIKRAELEGPAPVKVITRAQLEESGRGSVSEYLQQLPEAGYSENNENAPALERSYRGLSALNLRGFDPTNTLVLVDGRRAVLSGAGWNTTLFTDLNRFPAALVERIEILQDTGTLYGSGAAAGVVNLILRRDYTGAEFTARYANSLRTDIGERTFSLLAGGGDRRTQFTVALTYSAQNALRAADTDFARNADLTARYAAPGAPYAARAAAGVFDFRSIVGPQARVWLVPGQVNGLNGVSIPGLPPGAAITRLPGIATTPATSSANAVTPSFTAPARLGANGQFNAALAATFVPQVLTRGVEPSNYYNSNELLWLTPRKERIGFDLSWRHLLSPQVSAYGRVDYQHNWSFIAREPFAVSGQIVPRTNYWNPFGVDVAVAWRPVEVGPLTSSVVGETTTALLGLRGTTTRHWRWDTACSYGFDRNSEVYGNYLSRAAWETAIARNTPDAPNVFGGAGYRNPPAVIDPLRAYWDLQGKSRVYAWDGKISGDLFSLPTGPVGAGLLAEARRERFGDIRRTVDERATILGSSGIFDWSNPKGTRTVTSAAAELHAPLVRPGHHRFLYASDLSVTGRFDRYDEGYDSGLKPYFGLRVQPTRRLTLRASVARTFRAPTLPMLHGHASDRDFYWSDLRRPPALTKDLFDGPSSPRTARTEGNPALQPCSSRTWQYGFVVDVPGRWLKGLTLGATYSHLEESGTFQHFAFNPSFILNNEVNGGTAAYVLREPGTTSYTNTTAAPIPVLSGPDGTMTPVPPGATVTVPGRITLLHLIPINLAQQRAENCDFALTYLRSLGELGQVRWQSSSSYSVFRGMALPRVPLANTIGRDLYPRVRLQSSLGWTRREWGMVVSHQYIGPSGDLNRGSGVEVPSASTFGVQVSREFRRDPGRWLSGIRLTLGLDNVLDRDPPLAPNRFAYQSGNALRPAGRMAYVVFKKTQ